MENFCLNCGCGSCEQKPCNNESMGHCGHGKKHHTIKKVLIIVLLLVTFCLGYQMGEIKTILRGNYGYGMMDRYNNDTEMRNIWSKMSEQINNDRVMQIDTLPIPPVKK